MFTKAKFENTQSHQQHNGLISHKNQRNKQTKNKQDNQKTNKEGFTLITGTPRYCH